MTFINFSNTIIFNTTITYTSEVYPTYIRDYSNGVMNCLGNFSAMISQSLYVMFNSYGITIPYVFTAIFSALSSICYFFLPYETRGKQLDLYKKDVDDINSNIDEKGNIIKI